MATITEVEGVKSLKRDLEENFYAGLVEEVRLALEEKREIHYAAPDSGLYVMINEIMAEIEKQPKEIESVEGFR